MSLPADWIPIRWPKEWSDPALLGLLENTSVNCIVFEDGAPSSLIERARAAGRAAPRDDVVARIERAALKNTTAAGVLSLNDAVWPGVPMRRGGGDHADAGPTGMPWVDSNGWYIQLARTLAPGKTIWVDAGPPADAGIVRASAYPLAVADAAVYGARWVISFDPALRKSLAAREGRALETWKATANALKFFEQRRQWAELEPLGVVAVLSGFSGPDEHLSGEILNLLARRAVPFRIFEKGRRAFSFAGIKAVIYPDEAPPDEALRAKLLAFAESGGLVVTGPGWKLKPGEPAGTDPYRRYEIRAVGKGRVAIGTPESQDPYLIAVDTQLMLSHRHDLVRFFNSGTLNSRFAGVPDGRRAVLEIVNYSARASGNLVSVGFGRAYRSARIRTLEHPEPAPLRLVPTETGGVEAGLPPFSLYAGIELEG